MAKKQRWHYLMMLGFFLVVIFFFFYEITLLGKTFKTGSMIAGSMPYGTYGQAGNYGPCCATVYRETASLEEPFHQFMKTNFWQGVFPLWNPHQCLGLPTSLSMDASVFFPLTFLLYFLPNTFAMDVLFLARILVAFILMYGLMRAWGFSLLASVISAITFSLTGPMVVYHAGLLNADLILPLLFLAISQTFSYGKKTAFLLFSAATALNVFGGHPEHVFLTHLLAACYTVFLLLQKGAQSWHEKRRYLIRLFLFYCLGIGLSAIVLWPFLVDFIRYSWTTHTHHCGSSIQPFAEWISRLITMIVPHFFQKVLVTVQGDSVSWGGGYLGVVAVVLSALGLFLQKQRAIVIFFATVAVLTYGTTSSSFYTQWIGYLPLFNLMRLPAHTLYIFIFAIAVLSGAGAEKLLTHPRSAWLKTVGIILGVGIFLAVYLVFYRSADFFSQALKASLLSLGFLLLLALAMVILWLNKDCKPRWIVGGVACLLLAELFILAPRCRPKRFDSFPEVPYLEFLKEKTRKPSFRSQGLFLAFYRNTAMAYGVDSFVGSHTVLPYRYAAFVQRLVSPHLFSKICPGEEPTLTEESSEQGLMRNADMLALANVRYLISPRSDKAEIPAVYREEVKIVDLPLLMGLPQAIPRAYLAYDWLPEINAHDDDILGLLQQKRFAAFLRPIVEISPTSRVPQPQSPVRTDIGTVEEERRWANGVIFTAVTDRPAMLVLLDAYFPGWKVWVNGHPDKIYPVNYLFRGVFLPPGEHRIEFRFIPFWFYLGLAASLISLIIWCYIWRRNTKG